MPERFLLPTDFLPTKYKLQLEPDLKQYTFKGEAVIDLECHNTTDEITLNAADLEIHSASFTTQHGETHTANWTMQEKDERVVFKFPAQLSAGGKLHIEYTGELNDKMKGFYRSQYKWQGESRIMATTQFEANDARRAFPCWDEPNRKAVFEVSLIVDSHLTALCNTASLSTHSNPKTNKKTVTFAPSPYMSTYLLAFCVGEYDYIEDYIQLRETRIPARVYTVLGEAHKGRFALEMATKVLPMFEEMFDIPYPISKLDLIAIPEFSAGAMEHYGLVTFRETALLYDPKQSSFNTKQWIALVVTHELAHQWFGNYVSPKYWDYLYLNEAFATFIEYVGVDRLYPKWNIFNQFVQLDAASALNLDSMESSHPIEVPCYRAEDVDEIFDAISYCKGCTTLRMLVEYVGFDNFIKALRVYLKKFAYNNAESGDLWEAINQFTDGVDITSLMHDWTKKIGYPVIQVSEEAPADGHRIFRVKQQRFLQKGPNNDDTVWQIPLSYKTDQNSEAQYYLLDKREDTIKIPQGTKFVKFNSEQVGFYRVQYSEELLPSLVDAIHEQKLPAVDRLGILEDVFALAKSGYIDAKHAITIFSAFENEEDQIVVKALATNLSSFYNIIKRETSIEPLFKEFGRNIFAKLGQKLGWDVVEGESSLDTLKRSYVIASLKRFEDPETIKVGMEKFNQILVEGKSDVVSPDLLSSVYSIGVQHGGRAELDTVLKHFRSTQFNEDRVRCLSVVGGSKDAELLKSVINSDFLLKEVKSQDVMYAIKSIVQNKNEGREFMWDWFTKEFDAIRKRVDSGFLVGRIIKIVCSEFDTKEGKAMAEQFFAKQDLPQLKRTLAQALEAIDLNTVIRERIVKGISPEVLKDAISKQKQ